MSKSCTPVPAGTRFGTMVAVEAAPALSVKCLYRCAVCGHQRLVATVSLRVQIAKGRTTGCVRCNRKAIAAAGRWANRAVPVAAGERIGVMEAVAALANRTTRGEWRCVTCGYVKEANACRLAQEAERGCPACNKRAKPKRTEEELRAMRHKYSADRRERVREAMRVLPRHWRNNQQGRNNCQHDKELICVDPGGVEIRRCRECDQTGEPAVRIPFAGELFPARRRNFHDSEDAPSFENAVRVLEDMGGAA